MQMKISKSTVGIDIGSRMVKAIQLKKTKKTVELEKFGVADIFPEGEMNDLSEEQIRERKVTAIKRVSKMVG